MVKFETRLAIPEDAPSLAEISFDAFESVAIRHGFPNEAGSRDTLRWQINSMLRTTGIVAVIATKGGRIVGGAVADEVTRSPGSASHGPSKGAGRGVGRKLMKVLLERSRHRNAVGVRLVQAAHNSISLALYAKMGFEVREPLSVLNGPLREALPGRTVRMAQQSDIDICNALCRKVHGHSRANELRACVNSQIAHVIERNGRICGYATGFGYGWHAVAEVEISSPCWAPLVPFMDLAF